MKKLLLLLYVVALSAFIVSSSDKIQNEVKGKVTFSDCPKTFIKGNGYNKDGTEIMHSKDPMTQPDMNVIISFHPLDFKPKLSLTKDAYITQSEQTFIPNILPVVVGSKVHFLNEDEFFHNVQSYTRKSRFSIGRRAPGISYSVKIKKVGVIDLSCDIHSHMNAKILSFDTPYFCRVKEDGTYSIKNLPDGNYKVKVFHPNCDNLTKEVKLSGGKAFDFNFNLFTRS